MIIGRERLAGTSERLCRRFVILAHAAALIFWSLGAWAAAGTAPAAGAWDLERLMHDLAQVRSAKAKFVERKELAVLNSPLELSGTLIYTAPGRLEKHTLKPRPESLVLDEKTLTIEDKAKGRRRTIVLEEQPVLWAFVESIRATLAGDLKTLNRFYDVDLRGEERNWYLTLKPRDPRMQTVVDEIDIGGSRNQVRTIEIHETRGDRSLMTITDVTQ